MLEKVREYFESELSQTKTVIERKIGDEQAVWYAIQRCLGVADFMIEYCDITYEMIDPLFEEYKEKLNKLLTK